jgi:hypothetical protein
MYYLKISDWMIHFHNAKFATFAIFVFGHIGGDDLTGQAENFSLLASSTSYFNW